MEPRPKRLLDQVREALRLKHYSLRTEEAYLTWTRRNVSMGFGHWWRKFSVARRCRTSHSRRAQAG